MDDFAARLPLSRHEIDRDDAARGGEHLWRDLRVDPTTRILPVHEGRAPARGTAETTALELVTPEAAEHALDLDDAIATGAAVYLGRTTEEGRSGLPVGTRVIALSLGAEEAPAHPVELRDEADAVDGDGADAEGHADPAARILPSGAEWRPLRDVGLDLDAVDAGLFTQALAMHHWHEAHRFAPDTGEPLRAEHGGWVRRPVSGSGRSHFPRTDAAVIVAIIDGDDRILLGANAAWTPRRYSLLAGFVEPGESFEAAATREVYEESGARIVRPRYVGSQPWPFPASIMVGFIAELDPEQDPSTVRPDQAEIADLRWFTRDELAAASHLLPGRVSIARAIIEEWYGGPIPE